MNNRKALAYKKGDCVLWVRYDYYDCRLHEGVVSSRTETAVYVKEEIKFATGSNLYTVVFTEQDQSEYYRRGYTTYPFWMLRKVKEGEDLKKLRKRLEKATKLHRKYQDEVSKIEREVEIEARAWQRDEEKRRISTLPHGQDYMMRVLARAGFSQEKRR